MANLQEPSDQVKLPPEVVKAVEWLKALVELYANGNKSLSAEDEKKLWIDFKYFLRGAQLPKAKAREIFHATLKAMTGQGATIPEATPEAVKESRKATTGTASPSNNGTGKKTKSKTVELQFSDAGNARRLVLVKGDQFRFVHLWKKFLVWNTGRWQFDCTGAIALLAKTILVEWFQEATCQIQDLHTGEDITDVVAECREKKLDRLESLHKILDWCLRSSFGPRLNPMIDLAKSEPGIPVQPGQLDQDPWLFNVPNGTIELKTGKLREHRQADYITKICPTKYNAAAICPTWKKFLNDILQDADLVTYLQRFFGYCLTGSVQEQIIVIFTGQGSNGKTTLIKVICRILGPDYSVYTREELLSKGGGERHLTELASLFGKRLAVIMETDEETTINEARLKRLTGGDPLTCRRMREDEWRGFCIGAQTENGG
jgi:phage/plasmid-associated DNA primase